MDCAGREKGRNGVILQNLWTNRQIGRQRVTLPLKLGLSVAGEAKPLREPMRIFERGQNRMKTI